MKSAVSLLGRKPTEEGYILEKHQKKKPIVKYLSERKKKYIYVYRVVQKSRSRAKMNITTKA